MSQPVEIQVFRAASDAVFNTSSEEEQDIVYKFLRNRLTKVGLFGDMKDYLGVIKDIAGDESNEKLDAAYKFACESMEILKRDFGDPIKDADLRTDAKPKEYSKDEIRKAGQWATGDLSKPHETNNYPPSDKPPESYEKDPDSKDSDEVKQSFFSKYKTPLIIGGSLIGLGVVALLLLSGKKNENHEEQPV